MGRPRATQKRSPKRRRSRPVSLTVEMRTPAAIVATSISGILYALAFPTSSLHPLAWVALVPWLLALRDGSPRRALMLAWLWALVASYGLNDWFPRAVSTYYLQPAWVGAAFFLGVASLTAAPAFAGFAIAWRHVARAPTAATPFVAAAAWVAAELVRADLLGDPWALLGYSQVPVPVFLQITDATGVYGTSFVLAAVNVALALPWMGVSDSRVARRSIALTALLVAAVAGYGTVRLRALERAPGSPGIPIVVVQPNLDLGSQWRSEFYGANLDAYLGMTREALAHAPTPSLIVWPESALTFFLDDEAGYRASIAAFLAPTNAELVAGGVRTADGTMPPFHNTTFLLDASGTIAAWYDKRRLLPFAEYFPLGSIGLLQRHFGRVREFTPGEPRPPLPTSAGAAGIVVCNEALFSKPSRERVQEGATLLLSLANDSWVGEVRYAEQVAAMTLVRAIEQRRWLVRASTAGPSAVIAPSGSIVARSDYGTRDLIFGSVAAMATITPYGQVGDLFALACVVVTVAYWCRPST